MDPEDIWWVAPLVGFVGVLVGGAITWWVTWRTSSRALVHASALADRAALEKRAATDLARQQEARARIYLELLPEWDDKRSRGRGAAVLQQMRRLAWIAGDEDDIEVRALQWAAGGGDHDGAISDVEAAVKQALWVNVGNRLKGSRSSMPLPGEALDALAAMDAAT